MAETTKDFMEFVEKNYDHQFRSANYLMAAHGAALLLCLSAIKDVGTNSALKGLGAFIVLFGLGLIASIINYISMSLARSVMLNAARDEKDPNEDTVRFLQGLHMLALGFALGLLGLAILVMIWRFAFL
jgi:hypothetical protein